MKSRWSVILIVAVIIMGQSCQSEYDKTVKREMSSGVIHEDLFLGLKMGHTKKEFFAICWDLNAQEKVSQGPSNEMVKYIIEPEEIEGETQKIEMLFYGDFDEEKIMKGLRMQLSYVSWAPWNKELHAPELAKNIQPYLMDLYKGNDFTEIEIDIPDHNAFVKVDGNRQILVYPITNKDVLVKIEDLRYKLSNDDER